jgi:hypothetical protein
MAEAIHCNNVIIQRAIVLKETILEQKKELFVKVSGYDGIEFFIANDFDEFSIIWKELVELMCKILYHLLNHRTVLKYLAKPVTVGDWFKNHPDIFVTDDKTVMDIFNKYLISDFVSALPVDGDGLDFKNFHRKVIVKFDQLIHIVTYFEKSKR